MPKVFIEKLSGSTNGVNLVFETPKDFVPGSVRVFVNGIVLVANMDDGWTELGTKKVVMKIAPIPGDVLQAYYLVA